MAVCWQRMLLPHPCVCSVDPSTRNPPNPPTPTMCTADEEGSTKVFLAYHLQERLLTPDGMKTAVQLCQDKCKGFVAVVAEMFKTTTKNNMNNNYMNTLSTFHGRCSICISLRHHSIKSCAKLQLYLN
ncbi:unnamed protein product [Lota lota]